jgi:DNA polymerase-3 subunit gamma/tau
VVKSLNLIDHEQFFAACDSFLQQDVSALLNQYNQITATGFDGAQFIAGLADHVRNLLLSRDAKTVHLVEGSEALNQRYLEQSKKFNSSYLLSALDQINRTETTARNVKNQRLHFELCLMRLAMLPSAQRLSILSEDEKKN